MWFLLFIRQLPVIAIAEEGKFLHAPDTYMQKIAVGPEAKGAIDLKATPTENLKNIARAKKCEVEDLTVVILDRPRHAELIAEVRRAGARIYLIGDGDVSAAIATCKPNAGVDVLMGSGGAPEGVISAAALRCIGGDFQGQLIYDPAVVQTGLIGESREGNIARLNSMGINDPDKVYNVDELASGQTVLFAACGITPGTLMNGVRFFGGGARTQSLVISSQSKTARFVDTVHLWNEPKTIQLH
jgi:fructose-1,6-bisphosphatase II / sedoheptulose-1,7-bisphosphatase